MKFKIWIITLLFAAVSLSANESIHSFVDNYYDALSLQGKVRRPYMNYKSFSSNRWETAKSHPWDWTIQDRTPVFSFGNSDIVPENIVLFQSFNANTPHGMNDGGLWQGRGYNALFSAGISYWSDFLDLTLLPEIYFSQNLDYDIQAASPWSGSEYGYNYSGIDTPQRFGNESFSNFSWGQSQLRLKYKNWNIGVGSENVWLGPARHSALIWSHNAEGFPHIDAGLDRLDTPLGDVEFRMWWGWLKSSGYYEKAEAESYQDFLSGISFSYSPFFMPGFTVGFHKTSQVALEEAGLYSLIAAVDPGLIKRYTGEDGASFDSADGRASVTWSWMFSSVGFEFYGEWAMEDFTPSREHFFRQPGHAAAYTLGIKQILPWKNRSDRFFLMNAEISSLVWSRDYYINGLSWGGGFYRHYQTNLGYANEGQTIGSGVGTGGSLQHFEIDYFAPFGMVGLFTTRHKLDDAELYLPSNMNSVTGESSAERIPVQWTTGVTGYIPLGKGMALGGTAAYVFDMDRNMIENNDYHGCYLSLTAEFRY